MLVILSMGVLTVITVIDKNEQQSHNDNNDRKWELNIKTLQLLDSINEKHVALWRYQDDVDSTVKAELGNLTTDSIVWPKIRR